MHARSYILYKKDCLRLLRLSGARTMLDALVPAADALVDQKGLAGESAVDFGAHRERPALLVHYEQCFIITIVALYVNKHGEGDCSGHPSSR